MRHVAGFAAAAVGGSNSGSWPFGPAGLPGLIHLQGMSVDCRAVVVVVGDAAVAGTCRIDVIVGLVVVA